MNLKITFTYCDVLSRPPLIIWPLENLSALDTVQRKVLWSQMGGRSKKTMKKQNKIITSWDTDSNTNLWVFCTHTYYFHILCVWLSTSMIQTSIIHSVIDLMHISWLYIHQSHFRVLCHIQLCYFYMYKMCLMWIIVKCLQLFARLVVLQSLPNIPIHLLSRINYFSCICSAWNIHCASLNQYLMSKAEFNWWTSYGIGGGRGLVLWHPVVH